MNIHEAVQILVENKSTIIRKCEVIWEDADTARRAIEFNTAIETVEEHFRPAEIELEGGWTVWWRVCGECHGQIDSSDSFCRHCGRPVKA